MFVQSEIEGVFEKGITWCKALVRKRKKQFSPMILGISWWYLRYPLGIKGQKGKKGSYYLCID
jgi:hypothetical protein